MSGGGAECRRCSCILAVCVSSFFLHWAVGRNVEHKTDYVSICVLEHEDECLQCI